MPASSPLPARRRSPDRRRRRGRPRPRSARCSRNCGKSWCRWCARYRISRRSTTAACGRPSARRRSSNSALGGQAARLRPRARAPRPDASSVLHQVFNRRRADHHPRLRGRPRSGAVLDPARGRSCALRARRAPRARGTPLGRGASSGVHESQSRLWENLVGRSRAFWEHSYPLLRKTFPDQLAHVPLDASIAPSTRSSAR